MKDQSYPWQKSPRENKAEAYLVEQTKKLGGIAYKTKSPGHDGFPDRLVCLPFGVSAHVEMKRLGKKSTALQKMRQDELRALGRVVYAEVDSKEKVDAILAEMQKEVVRRMFRV